MNYLITGATGFIGQRLIANINGNIRVLSRNKYLNYDTVVCDFEKDLIPDSTLFGVDIVFHLAGIAHDVNYKAKAQDIYQKVNSS